MYTELNGIFKTYERSDAVIASFTMVKIIALDSTSAKALTIFCVTSNFFNCGSVERGFNNTYDAYTYLNEIVIQSNLY